jgi:hypothetical protein
MQVITEMTSHLRSVGLWNLTKATGRVGAAAVYGGLLETCCRRHVGLSENVGTLL